VLFASIEDAALKGRRYIYVKTWRSSEDAPADSGATVYKSFA
jgi:hypothetical protein